MMKKKQPPLRLRKINKNSINLNNHEKHVAVGGLEPPTSCQYVGRILQVTALYQLSYTAYHVYMISITEAV